MSGQDFSLEELQDAIRDAVIAQNDCDYEYGVRIGDRGLYVVVTEHADGNEEIWDTRGKHCLNEDEVIAEAARLQAQMQDEADARNSYMVW
jgi:hypothetical protein